MTHNRIEGRMYRMPYGFGPTAGPRQGPNGERFDWAANPHRRAVSVSFLTAAAHLERILPPGFELIGEPVVTVELQNYTELEWLAGRGYNTLGVRFPARFNGVRDKVQGGFLSVLWENLADPILSGRDELGFAKLYCELPPPRVFRGHEYYFGEWLGHRFVDMEISRLVEAPKSVPPLPGLVGPNDGTLHYKYLPSTGTWGEDDIDYACLTPSTGSQMKVSAAWKGEGRVRFHPTTWEQMPTQFHVVSALAALPQLEARGATLLESRGAKDLSDQRALA